MKLFKPFLAAFSAVCLSVGVHSMPVEYGLADDAKVPILLYHSRHVEEPCTYGHNDLLALAEDLETLHAEGYTVMPLYWLTEWAMGWRSGATLPKKVVGISLDDGYDSDFLDRAINIPEGCPTKSAYTIIKEFREKYEDELPDLSPHMSVFVIASREVRRLLEDGQFGDNWWAMAHHSPYMEVYNHGSDHDHTIIQEPLWEPLFEEWLPASGHGISAKGEFVGKLDPVRVDNLISSRIHIAYAAEYIASRIGVWPDLFAHPMGRVSNYTRDVYLPYYFHEHGTVAAYCTEKVARGPRPENYLQRGQNRYCLPRLTHNYSWRTPEEFLAILQGSGQ